jgi:hypothetical protein
MEAITQGARIAGFVFIIDSDGQRHAIRATAVSVISDADIVHDETVLQLGGGRTVRVPVGLDEVLSWFQLGSAR